MIVPRRRLAAAIAAAAPLWLLPHGGVIVVAAMAVVAVAVVVDAWRLPGAKALKIARETPSAIGLGDEAEAQYIVRNASNTPVVIELSDRLPSIIHAPGAYEPLIVERQGSRTWRFGLRGISRGESELGPVGLRVSTALGLLELRTVRVLGDRVRVVPSTSGVRRFRLLAMQHRLQNTGIRVLRRRGEGQSFSALREYVRGDDPRHLDWKASAKRGKLITREFTVERSQNVITVVDAGRAMTQRAGATTRFEHALSAALLLTDVAANGGDRVGTLVFDDETRVWVPPLRSRGALQIIRDAYVPAFPRTVEPDYATAFRFLSSHQRKRALIVFFTDVIDVRASRALVAYTSRSAIRHLVVVVALRNDDLFHAERPVAGASTARAYDSAAAAEAIEAREGALEQMRRAGVVVIDSSPLTMAAGVVNRYLELKSRGAI